MRKFPLGLIILIIWMLLVSTGLYVYIFHLQPNKLNKTVSDFLKAKTNLEFNIGSIGFSIAPSPAIIVQDANFYNKSETNSINAVIHINKVEGILSWRSLFMLKPVLKQLNIEKPAVQIKIAEKKTQEQSISIKDISKIAAEKMFAYLKQFSIPHYFHSLKLFVNNAQATIIDSASDITYFIDNLNIFTKTPNIIDGFADIQAERLDILYQNSPLFQLNKTKICAHDVFYNPKNYGGNLSIETQVQVSSLQHFYDTPISPVYNYFPMPEPSSIRLDTNFNIAILKKELTVNGTLHNKTILPMNSYNTPIELKIPFSLTSTFDKSNKSTLAFPYDDKSLAPYKSEFLKENDLLDYAIDLPGFYVNEVKINNAEIKADTDSLIFNGALTGLYPFNPLIFGKADVQNFSLPRWIGPTRNMSGGLFNALNKIQANIDVFCTLKGVFAPKLAAKVLNYKITGKSVTANFLKPDICFDLTVHSNTNIPLDLNPLFPEINGKETKKVKLPPPAVDITHNNSKKKSNVKVAYHINIAVPKTAHIWKIDSSGINILISPDKEETPTIAVKIKNLYTGTATANVSLYSDKKHKIHAKAQSVLLEAPLRSILGYTAATGFADADINLSLSGDTLGKILNSLEISGNANIYKGAFHTKESMLTQFSKVFAQIDVKTVSFNPNKTLPKAFALGGKWILDGNFSKHTAKFFSDSSTIHFSTENGQPLYRLPQSTNITFVEKASDKTIFNGNGKFGFDINNNSLTVENYRGMLRNSKLIANVNFIQKAKPIYTGNLYFQHFELNDYIKEHPENNNDKELPLDFICNNEVDLAIKADKLTCYDITLKNFTGNIQIKDNKISINNLRTQNQNEIVQALLEGSVIKKGNKHYMQTLFKMKAEHINMLSISKMRKQKTLMSGTGNMAIQGNTLINRTSDIIKNLNANWNISFVNGYFQSNKNYLSQNQQTETGQFGKTKYNNLCASGTIKNGIANASTIIMHSNTLDILANGTVNLINNKINAEAKAKYLGIPDIPVSIKGTIDKPEYDVKVFNAVSKTLGNIGLGFFDAFFNIITQPFILFMP